MKKRRTIVATLLMMFALAACEAHEHTDIENEDRGSYSPIAGEKLQAFELKDVNIYLTTSQSYQLESVTYPVFPEKAQVTYTSNNPSVVSVDENGKLKANNDGFAIVTATCEGMSSYAYVNVTPEDTTSVGKSNLKKVSTAQGKSTFVKPTYLSIRESTYDKLYRDNAVQIDKVNYEEMVIDKDEAYLYIADHYDSNSKTDGANATYSIAKWVIYCTDEFETFLFHEQNGVRRYIKVDCSKYVESGTRLDALYDVLAKLFISGSSIVTNQLNTVGDKDETDGIYQVLTTKSKQDLDIIASRDARGDDFGNVFATYCLDFGKELVDFELASNMDLPSGVYANISRDETFYYTENYCRSFNVDYHLAYDWRGSHYASESSIARSYDIERKELYYPDIESEGWARGEDIFDI